jgi:hypothetical protein
VVLDLSSLAPRERLDYLRALHQLIEAERSARGLPHWIVIDEAHVTLAEGGIAADVFRPTDRGYGLMTFHPEYLSADALAAIDVTISLDTPAVMERDGLAPVARTATLREAGSLERSFTVSVRRTPHIRHRHKYAVAPLPHRWFRFRRPDGQVVAAASNLEEFSRLLRDIDPSVLAHHLVHGDFSRWTVGMIQDRDLAAAVGAIERNALARRANDLRHVRSACSTSSTCATSARGDLSGIATRGSVSFRYSTQLSAPLR